MHSFCGILHSSSYVRGVPRGYYYWFLFTPNFLSFPILSYVYFFIRGEHTFVFFDFLGERSVWFLRKKHFPLLSFPFKQKKSDQVSLLKKPFQKPKNRIILFCSIHILFYYITTTQDNFN